MPKYHLSIFLLSTCLWAQSPPHRDSRTELRGELQIDGTDHGHDFQVELADCSSMSPGVRGRMSDGYRFEFDDVESGCKTVRVVDGPQRTIVQEVRVFVEGPGLPLVIRIPASAKDPVIAGTVSADRLRHPLPQSLVRAMGDANRLWKSGRTEEAGKKLRPVVAKYPGFWEPRVSLGLVELKLQNLAAAAEHFAKAHELEPHSPVAALYAGFTLYRVRRLDEAESAAKAAVALDPGNPLARTLLAQIQAVRKGATH